jgi:hypothetical protein
LDLFERYTARSIGTTKPGLPPILGEHQDLEAQLLSLPSLLCFWAAVSLYRQRSAGASKPLAIGGRGGNAAALVLSVNGLLCFGTVAVAALRALDYKIPSGRYTYCFFSDIACCLFSLVLYYGVKCVWKVFVDGMLFSYSRISA